jgi:hypothetical protein
VDSTNRQLDVGRARGTAHTIRFLLGRTEALTSHRASTVNVVVNENPADQAARREGRDKLQGDARTTLLQGLGSPARFLVLA